MRRTMQIHRSIIASLRDVSFSAVAENQTTPRCFPRKEDISTLDVDPLLHRHGIKLRTAQDRILSSADTHLRHPMRKESSAKADRSPNRNKSDSGHESSTMARIPGLPVYLVRCAKWRCDNDSRSRRASSTKEYFLGRYE